MQQRRWKSLVHEICVADLLCNQDHDYMLKPFEFVKKPDRCCLITEYPNGPRVSDILKLRKECGFVMQINASSMPSFKDEVEVPQTVSETNFLDGYLSDSETRSCMRQIISIASDLYSNKLCSYDFSPDNFLTEFRHKSQLIAPEDIIVETEHSDVGITDRPKLRSNTILVSQTEQPNSLIHILDEYNMTIKLM